MLFQLFILTSSSYNLVPASRQPSSDSDSEYGARSKKKKRPRVSADEVRTSSRGVKVPNYADDLDDFAQYDEPDPGYYIDTNAQVKEEDEIETVLTHSRDEGREGDAEDLWYDNIVCTCISCECLYGMR
jgi:chromodomain-helicase-DNA-binding protein 1